MIALDVGIIAFALLIYGLEWRKRRKRGTPIDPTDYAAVAAVVAFIGFVLIL
ncbi:hypothetical protein [Euzebya tangerina]|uniref:hypothetical protein n=1 Tax=Euzebya tangerina TaxID=591198 RepID=UPI0013C31076|nr:hypothetical protein [Euzebya tangerina]